MHIYIFWQATCEISQKIYTTSVSLLKNLKIKSFAFQWQPQVALAIIEKQFWLC